MKRSARIVFLSRFRLLITPAEIKKLLINFWEKWKLSEEFPLQKAAIEIWAPVYCSK